MDDRDRAYFGRGDEEKDKIGFIDEKTRAIFGRSYAAEPDVLIEQLKTDEAIAEADTLLLTVPNQLGVAYNAHVIEAILTHVAPASAGVDANQPLQGVLSAPLTDRIAFGRREAATGCISSPRLFYS